MEKVINNIDYTRLPEGLRKGTRLWIEHGIIPSYFLCAVIQNNLSDAFWHADDDNINQMFDIVKWWYNNAPGNCWGSVEKFNVWIAKHAKEKSCLSERQG